MAGFFDKVNSFAQNAVDKGKEVAEVTKLNMSISTQEDKIKKIKMEIGEYIAVNFLLFDDDILMEKMDGIKVCQDEIAALRQKIQDAKNIVLCSSCGAELSKDSKFCVKCGTPVPEAPAVVEEGPVQESIPNKTCPGCGKEVAGDSAFCTECGMKIE